MATLRRLCLDDGLLVSAIEEERLNRIKHWAGFPNLAAAAVPRRNGSGTTWSTSPFPRSLRAHFAEAVACRHPAGIVAAVHVARRPISSQVARLSAERPGTHSARTEARPHSITWSTIARTSPAPSSPRPSKKPPSSRWTDSAISPAFIGASAAAIASRARLRPVPAFARHPLHRLHPVSGLPQVRRRIQNDGPRGLRRAAVRSSKSARSSKTEIRQFRLDLDYFTHHSRGRRR